MSVRIERTRLPTMLSVSSQSATMEPHPARHPNRSYPTNLGTSPAHASRSPPVLRQTSLQRSLSFSYFLTFSTFLPNPQPYYSTTPVHHAVPSVPSHHTLARYLPRADLHRSTHRLQPTLEPSHGLIHPIRPRPRRLLAHHRHHARQVSRAEVQRQAVEEHDYRFAVYLRECVTERSE